MYYTKEFIDCIKQKVKESHIPPIYNPEEWSKRSRDFNCYAYVLQINNISLEELDPGFTIGITMKKKEITAESVLKNFLIDCENLNLNVSKTTIDEEIGKDAYKIALFVINGFTFHFIRQDSNGAWSHKRGWLDPIAIINESDILKEDNLYKLVGIFKISKKKE